MAELGIIPDVPGAEGYLELGATPQGTLWKKHFMTLGPRGAFVHPKTGKRLQLDEAWFDRLKSNFDAKTATDHVQVPVVGADNKHTESPLANIGEVVDLQREGDKLYAIIDARDEAASAKLGKTLLGCSAFLAMDATDPRTGRKAGPALYHLAVTNRGHLVELEPWEKYAPVIQACAQDVVLPDGTVWSDAPDPLMLCAPEVDPVMLADPDYQPEPDYYGGPDMDEQFLRDEGARLGLAAMQLSSGRGTKPDYPIVITDRDRELALAAGREVTDTELLEAAGELAMSHRVSPDSVLVMAHDAHRRSGTGFSIAERVAVFGEVAAALSRGRLEVTDEQIVALSQGQRAGEDELVRMTSDERHEGMFLDLAAHPSRSGKLVDSASRAHSSELDEDTADADQPGKGGRIHPEVARCSGSTGKSSATTLRTATWVRIPPAPRGLRPRRSGTLRRPTGWAAGARRAGSRGERAGPDPIRPLSPAVTREYTATHYCPDCRVTPA